MELVRSGGGDDVNDAASGPTSFGSVAVRLDGDLLDAFDVRLDADGADDAFVVVNSVDDPIVEARILAVYREAGGVRAAIVRTGHRC